MERSRMSSGRRQVRAGGRYRCRQLAVASSSLALQASENALHASEKPAFSSSQALLVPACKAPKRSPSRLRA